MMFNVIAMWFINESFDFETPDVPKLVFQNQYNKIVARSNTTLTIPLRECHENEKYNRQIHRST